MAEPVFPASEFATRHQRVWNDLEKAGLRAIVAYSPANVFWLTGFRGPTSPGPIAAYVQQVVAPKAVLSVGRPPSLTGLLNFAQAYAQETHVADIRPVRTPVPGRPRMIRDILQSQGILSGPIGVDFNASGGITPHELAALRSELQRYELLDCTRLLAHARSVKTANEIECLRKAVRIQNAAYDAFRQRLSMKMTEADVSFEMLRCQHEAGAEEPGLTLSTYHPAGALFGAALASRRPQPGEFQWFDAGVSVNGYVCDFDLLIAWGEPSPEQQRIHAHLRDVYEEALSSWLPGRRLADIAADTVHTLKTQGIHDPLGGGFLGHCLGAEVVERPWISVGAPGDLLLEPGMIVSPEWVSQTPLGNFL
jgi:Xaa-Pro aminopeptidase